MLNTAGELTEGSFVRRTVAHNAFALFPAVYNCLYSICWLQASQLEFDILLGRIRYGGDLPADHALIAERDSVDKVVKALLDETATSLAEPAG